MKPPVRCHLLIGPPASGKTTLAHRLAPLLAPPGHPPALLLSTIASAPRCSAMRRCRGRGVRSASGW